MQARLTTKPQQEVIAAIQALDLESVKLRITDPKLGEGWTREYADSIESAYKNFLSVIVKHQDAAEDILPSKDVDEFWHTHILQTMKYADDCQAVFGTFLHHNPHIGELTQADLEKRDELAEKTRQFYELEFGARGADAAWAGDSIRADGAAVSGVAIRQEGAAVSGVAIRAGSAAVSGVAIRQEHAAVSGVAIRAERAAVSGVAIRQVNAAVSGVAIRAERAACPVVAIRPGECGRVRRRDSSRAGGGVGRCDPGRARRGIGRRNPQGECRRIGRRHP